MEVKIPTIADLPRDERPRERMLLRGAENLSDAELVALLLGSGTDGKSALYLARELLAEGMEALRCREISDLTHFRGVGRAKATRLAAAFELARRLDLRKPEKRPPFDRDVIARSLMKACRFYDQERLGAMFLDSRHRVMAEREVFVGTIDKALVSTRDIVRLALSQRALGVVLYHNHVSGDPSPSGEDRTFTAKMKQSLDLLDMRLVDHLIVGTNQYVSLAEKGWLPMV